MCPGGTTEIALEIVGFSGAPQVAPLPADLASPQWNFDQATTVSNVTERAWTARSSTFRRSLGGGLPDDGDVRERLRRRVLRGETARDVHATHEGDVSELLGVFDEASQSI